MKSVLSIQSHVSHGYVGGRAAIFPLQCQGWEVDSINTVNFSNHTGYGSVRGSSINEGDLVDIFKGLNDIQVSYDAVITGYIPNASLIAVINENIKSLKLNNNNLMYLLDPVMGDQGFLYVDESCIDEYKKILEDRIVDIITPNQFELELLVGFKVKTESDLKDAINHLHSKFNIKYVVISSLTDIKKSSEDLIYCAISTIDDNKIQIFSIPVINSYFTGVGDLFSALLLDKLYENLQSNEVKTPNLSKAVSQVLTIMLKTLSLTHKLGIESYCKDKNLTTLNGEMPVSKVNDDVMKYFELRIIQSKDFFAYDGIGEFKPEYL
ncbi:uncharacterized protein AC631_05879 [Debaryomyces fabryi]|uniref:pyridoxal kinase n=1 Tax=Debaryomyces fabryi TaxID=58627 RepID=A0A0V1PQ42_9ASCO|nr:uncharacterized protein AC631_05879 [Debaryomyces fabryi]KRZ98360.1 hypothetical protein AC631_05879 [Debaryomyces fabryi]CUM46547.1 unnamed protein product [Debaryomyces fabryi]